MKDSLHTNRNTEQNKEVTQKDRQEGLVCAKKLDGQLSKYCHRYSEYEEIRWRTNLYSYLIRVSVFLLLLFWIQLGYAYS